MLQCLELLRADPDVEVHRIKNELHPSQEGSNGYRQVSPSPLCCLPSCCGVLTSRLVTVPDPHQRFDRDRRDAADGCEHAR
eukprot:3649068-Rhodomonas_salina.1